MSGLRIIVRALAQKNNISFNDIKNIRIVSSLDSPADSLSATAAVSDLYGDFDEVKAYDGARLLFSGRLDCRRDSVSGDGMMTRLDARSAGALLLDNQALPAVLQNAQIGVLFGRCIAPYGFSLYNPNRAAYIPMFTVRAGCSEWDAFTLFSRRAYGVTPYVRGMQVLLKRPPGLSPTVISNSGEGVRYISITHQKTPYHILSRVVLRDEKGAYTLAVKNSEAAYTKTVRKRYMVPASEYAGQLQLDANQRIRRSMLEYERISVTLPGFLEIAPGSELLIRDGKIRLSNLIVRERVYTGDENGFVTRLEAVNSRYYD